jgi:phosphate uptake regulator
MKRKINLVGQNTLTVSLPSKWAKEHGLKKGDEIEVEENPNSLILSAEKQLQYSKFEKEVTNIPSQLIERSIMSAYEFGFDEITLTFKYNKTVDLKKNSEITIIQIVYDTIDFLMGLEVVGQGATHITMKQITQISDHEFDNVLRRIYLLLLDQAELTKNILFDKFDKDVLQDVKMKRNTIKKLVLYCIRVLNKKGHRDAGKTSLYSNLLFNLDEINSIHNYIASGNQLHVFKKPSSSLMEKTNASLRLLYELQYDFNIGTASKVISLRRDFFNAVNKFEKLSADEATFVSRLTMLILKNMHILDLLLALNN